MQGKGGRLRGGTADTEARGPAAPSPRSGTPQSSLEHPPLLSTPLPLSLDPEGFLWEPGEADPKLPSVVPPDRGHLGARKARGRGQCPRLPPSPHCASLGGTMSKMVLCVRKALRELGSLVGSSGWQSPPGRWAPLPARPRRSFFHRASTPRPPGQSCGAQSHSPFLKMVRPLQGDQKAPEGPAGIQVTCGSAPDQPGRRVIGCGVHGVVGMGALGWERSRQRVPGHGTERKARLCSFVSFPATR